MPDLRILVIDNYDSFVFNLVQYLGQLGTEAVVWRNDDAQLGDLDAVTRAFDGVLISPGPGTPERAGVSVDLVTACAATETPLLGVCLGHQAIGVAFGATVERAPELRHGKTSVVEHTGAGVLAGLPDPFVATRYHSLTVRADTIPAELEATAWAIPDRPSAGRTHHDARIVMAMRHRELPIHGVQFHPESVLTQGGHRMLANWLAFCGRRPAEPLVRELEAEVAALAG